MRAGARAWWRAWENRGGCCWWGGRLPGRCRHGKAGAVLPGAVEGKKIKASTFLCKPFSILHIAGEPFNGHAENAGKYDKFIIGYKAQAGFYAADRLAPYAKTGTWSLAASASCERRCAVRAWWILSPEILALPSYV